MANTLLTSYSTFNHKNLLLESYTIEAKDIQQQLEMFVIIQLLQKT